MAAPLPPQGQYPSSPPQQQWPGMPMPGQQPGYGQVPLAPAANNSKIIVIVVIVVVAVIAVVAIVIPLMLYVAVSGLGPGNTPMNTTMVLQGGSWSGGNLTFSISSITSANVDPTQLTYIIESSGTTYYVGSAGLNTSTSGISVNVQFRDTLDAGHASAGDSIRVTVTPVQTNPLHGGTLKVFFNNAAISTVTIP